MTRAKQFSGYHYQREFNERLWGLARSVREYPYLGSTLYTLDQILDGLHLSG